MVWYTLPDGMSGVGSAWTASRAAAIRGLRSVLVEAIVVGRLGSGAAGLADFEPVRRSGTTEGLGNLALGGTPVAIRESSSLLTLGAGAVGEALDGV